MNSKLSAVTPVELYTTCIVGVFVVANANAHESTDGGIFLFYLRPFVMHSTFNNLKLSAKKAESEAHV